MKNIDQLPKEIFEKIKEYKSTLEEIRKFSLRMSNIENALAEQGFYIETNNLKSYFDENIDINIYKQQIEENKQEKYLENFERIQKDILFYLEKAFSANLKPNVERNPGELPNEITIDIVFHKQTEKAYFKKTIEYVAYQTTNTEKIIPTIIKTKEYQKGKISEAQVVFAIEIKE